MAKHKGNTPQKHPDSRREEDPIKNTDASKFKISILNGLILAMLGIALLFYGAPVWAIVFFAAGGFFLLSSLRYRKR